MLLLRSMIYNCLFFVVTAALLVFWVPVFFFLPQRDGWKVVKTWGYLILWLHRNITGCEAQFRGLENLPDGGFLVAAKHQSTWETVAILLFMDDPAYILKRELMFLPLFGWYAAKMRMIPVHRGKKGVALTAMTAAAQKEMRNPRQIIIFPEGTRTAPGAEPRYKIGIARLYEKISCPVVPVALNSGLLWPRNSFYRHPGTITMEFLPPIMPGLDNAEFAKKLQVDIETATDRLLAQ